MIGCATWMDCDVPMGVVVVRRFCIALQAPSTMIRMRFLLYQATI